MKLPLRVQQIVQELYDRHKALSKGSDDQRRELAMLIAQQVRYEFGPMWGTKRGDPGRPLSKDAIAQKQPGGALFGWDLFNGATGAPHVNPSSIDISKQTFVAVSPVDHLSGGTTIPGDPPPPLPPTPPPATSRPYNEGYAVEFGQSCNDVYRETPANKDAGMIAVHASRAAYDFYVGGMKWPDAKRKHVNGFRAVYALPPV